MDNRPLQLYLTSSEGREITSNGWKAAFIEEALIKGTKGLDPLDPFALIDPLSEEVDSINFAVTLNMPILIAKINLANVLKSAWFANINLAKLFFLLSIRKNESRNNLSETN